MERGLPRCVGGKASESEGSERRLARMLAPPMEHVGFGGARLRTSRLAHRKTQTVRLFELALLDLQRIAEPRQIAFVSGAQSQDQKLRGVVGMSFED